MCGSTIRQARPGVAMAALFHENKLQGRIYLNNSASGDTFVQLIPEVTSLQGSKWADTTLRVHEYGGSSHGCENPVMYTIDALDDGSLGQQQDANILVRTEAHSVVGRGVTVINEKGGIVCSGVIGWN